jgi:hypothetical protein
MRIVKWLVILVILFLAWKAIEPRLRKSGAPAKSSAGNPAASCADSAARASEAWGSGLRQFVNPPYDVTAWNEFKGHVEGRIASAESDCNCQSDGCTKGRQAMRELRSLVSDLDYAIRNGSSPPLDAVQRQESIDNLIDQARGSS